MCILKHSKRHNSKINLYICTIHEFIELVVKKITNLISLKLAITLDKTLERNHIDSYEIIVYVSRNVLKK